MKKVAGNPMVTFAYPEDALDGKTVKEFAGQTDVAIYVLSRNSGEGADRCLSKKIELDGKEYELGDYRLTQNRAGQPEIHYRSL